MDFNKYKEEFYNRAYTEGYDLKEISILLAYAKRLNDKGLPIIYSLDHFSRLVGYSWRYIIAVCNSQYLFYKSFSIPKKNGGERILHEPFPSLKEIQFWILKNILEPAYYENVSPVAKAFIPGKNLRENARFHKNKNYVIALDLKDFFGTVHFGRVCSLFKKLGYCKSVSVLLANLCICDNSLPQGAPTSPMLSNLVFKNIDDKILKYCRNREINYTRYADDLTFSSNIISVQRLISYVKMLVSSHGFVLNEDKTKVMKKNMSQNVTGIIVNKKMQVPVLYRKKIRQEIYFLIKFGISGHMSQLKDLPDYLKTPYAYIKHLYGKVNFVLSVNSSDDEFIKYKKFLKEYLKNMQ